MTPKRSFLPAVVLMILPILACVILPAPLGNQDRATETQTVPAPVTFTETAPATAPATASTAEPTSTPATPQDTALPPTTALAPELQLHMVTDETGAIEANIPTVWTDTRTEPWVNEKGEKVGTIFTASTNIEAFLKFQAEGVSISVSRHLPVGYVQLLETEYKVYVKQCQDTYKTRWTLEDPVYKGMYFVFGECAGTQYTWLSLFTAASKKEPGKFVARIVAYDMAPIYADDFRAIIMKFKVNPENLP